MAMGLIIFLLFVSVPIIEIGIFISVGERIGLWPTIGAIIVTAALGAALLRHQGLQTLARAHAALNENRPPVAEVFEGACLVFAGALLLTPGFLTDAIGFALMLPPLRRWIVAAIVARAAVRVHTAHAQAHTTSHSAPRGPGPGDRTGPVIDGEFEEVDPNDPGAGPGGGPDRLPPTAGR